MWRQYRSNVQSSNRPFVSSYSSSSLDNIVPRRYRPQQFITIHTPYLIITHWCNYTRGMPQPTNRTQPPYNRQEKKKKKGGAGDKNIKKKKTQTTQTTQTTPPAPLTSCHLNITKTKNTTSSGSFYRVVRTYWYTHSYHRLFCSCMGGYPTYASSPFFVYIRILNVSPVSRTSTQQAQKRGKINGVGTFAGRCFLPVRSSLNDASSACIRMHMYISGRALSIH